MEKKSAGLFALLLSSVALMSCAKVGFNQGTNTNVASAKGSTPKIQFISPACAHGTNCEVDFKLDGAYPESTQFDWKTNDTAYLTPHTPVYGQPNVHYIPTSGHLVFQPGQTALTVYVQNINPNNFPILIGITVSGCAYGTTAPGCASFF